MTSSHSSVQPVEASRPSKVFLQSLVESPTAPAKRYACGSCTLCFRRAEHLARHVLTHSGDKPFQCGVCSRGFSRADALRRHDRIHVSDPFVQAAQDGRVSAASAAEPTEEPSGPIRNQPASARKHPYSPVAAPSVSSPIPEQNPRSRGPGLCPSKLRELAASTVILVFNADRAMYQCPVRGCKHLITSTHLSHHLESRRALNAAENTSTQLEQSDTSNSSAPRPFPQCTTLGTRDLVAYVDHIFERHSVSAECRDCGSRGHVRADYYSVENAPCVMPACGDHSELDSIAARTHGGGQAAPKVTATLHAVLAGSIQLYEHAQGSGKSGSDSEDDPLLTLAMCAADELARFSPIQLSPTSAPLPLPFPAPVLPARLSDSHRVRIQDLIN
ncbi:hypothetical protein HKX48_007394 [Thoreauomyces humboldtii]|nr:hypothetical protein HKX48_007394 [Thoreauomyces humboldtii]